MDKYYDFMQELREYLSGTWLARPQGYPPHPRPSTWEPMTGSSMEEIQAAEAQIGKKLPPALVAWYAHFGKVPPYINDYDADFSLRDLISAQETAQDFWGEIPSHLLPFSQRTGDQFLYIDLTLGDLEDPPMFHFMEKHKQVDIAFTSFVREGLISWLNVGWITYEARNKSHPLRSIEDELKEDCWEIRKQFTKLIFDEDRARGAITGPRTFQARWIEMFSTTETWRKIQTLGLKVPWGYVEPPKDNMPD